MRARGSFEETRVKRDMPHQSELARIDEMMERRLRNERAPAVRVGGQLRHDLARIAKNRLSAGMRVLNVKDRVIARVLDHLGQVEIEDRIVIAVKHHEADRIATDLLDHFTQ